MLYGYDYNLSVGSNDNGTHYGVSCITTGIFNSMQLAPG